MKGMKNPFNPLKKMLKEMVESMAEAFASTATEFSNEFLNLKGTKAELNWNSISKKGQEKYRKMAREFILELFKKVLGIKDEKKKKTKKSRTTTKKRR